jgi:hypothetical protein
MRSAVILTTLLVGAARSDTIIEVGRFAERDRIGWQVQQFEGETAYSFEQVDGRQGLRAVSQGSASGLYRKMKVDLARTPYMEWSWRVAGVLQDVDERTRSGDDYPARVYVVVSGGLAFWRTRSLVYVWSSNQPTGSTWNNAFTPNARVMALRSGTTDANRWVHEKRNLIADFRQLFGNDIHEIDVVAIMTDTDNSDQSATAWYGDITFVPD